jgi:hypothetical protein
MSDDAFLQMMSGQSPGMFRGNGLPLPQGPFNMPTSNPLVGMLMQAVANPLMKSQASGLGMVPGQFLPTQNLVDQRMSAKYAADQQKILAQLSQMDQKSAQQLIQGGARFFGQEISDKDAQQMGQDVTGLLPMLAQIVGPDNIDMMAGKRGSATILGMSLQRAGFHGVDSATGRAGQSADTVAALGEELFANQFGSDESMRRMKGLRAGQAGSLLEELSRRGLGGRGVGGDSVESQVKALAEQPDLTDAQVARIAKRSGSSVEEVRTENQQIRAQAAGLSAGKPLDMEKLEQLNTMGEQLRSFDAVRVGKKLEDMSGAVSAMRDIFGDMGHPNAPMSMLVAGLDALTQGGLSNMTPANAEKTVRNTYNLAKRAGVSMEAVAGMTAQAAQQADRLGLDRGLVPGIVQGSLAYGGGLGQSLALDIPKFGAADKERLTAMDQQLRTNAAGSPMANRLGALMRMGDDGLLEGPAKEMYDKLATGNTDVDVPKDDAAFMKLMSQSSVGTSTARQALKAKRSNQEQIGKYDAVIQTVRESQFEDILKPMQSSVGSAATGEYINQFPAADRVDVKAKTGEAIMRAVQETPSDVRRTPEKLNPLIERVITEQADARGVKLSPKAAAAARFAAVGQMDTLAEQANFGNSTVLFDLVDKNALEQQKKAQGEASVLADRQSTLAGVPAATTFSRISDAIQNFKPTGKNDEMRMLLQALGAQDVSELSDIDPVLRTYADQKVRQQTADTDTAAGKRQFGSAQKIIEGLKRGGVHAERAIKSAKRELPPGLKVLSSDTTRTALDKIERSDLPQLEKDRLTSQFQALDAAATEGGADQLIEAIEADQPADALRPENPKTLKDTTPAPAAKVGVGAGMGAKPGSNDVKMASTDNRATKAPSTLKLTGSVRVTGLQEMVLDLESMNSGMMWADGASYPPSNLS